MDQLAPCPSEELFICAGRSSCSLTGTTVQLLSGSKVTLMLATTVVDFVVWGFCVCLCCLCYLQLDFTLFLICVSVQCSKSSYLIRIA